VFVSCVRSGWKLQLLRHNICTKNSVSLYVCILGGQASGQAGSLMFYFLFFHRGWRIWGLIFKKSAHNLFLGQTETIIMQFANVLAWVTAFFPQALLGNFASVYCVYKR